MARTIEQPDQPEVTDMLKRMRQIEVPPVDPARERALLDAFDSHWAQPAPAAPRWSWSTVAGLAVIVAGLNWLVVLNTPRVGPLPAERAVGMSDFVPLPGAEGWPPFESGTLVRMNLPVSALFALGLPAPSSTVSVVQADVVVGQDGLARAIRIVQ